MRRHHGVRYATVLLAASVAASCSPSAMRTGEPAGKPSMLQVMLEAREKGVQIAPLTSTHGPLTIETAYGLQAMRAREMAKTDGPLAGYKVAFASRAAQKQFGMDEPARGPFHLSQRVPDGATLPDTAFNEILLETEVAFTIGKPVRGPVRDVAALRPYVKWMHAAFDAGDFPYASGGARPGPADIVAIGTGAHRFVIGPAVDPDAVDLATIDLSLSRDGEAIRKSPAREVLGNPWNSLLWCVNHLHRFGLGLEPGMVVLTGTAAPAYRARGDAIRGAYVGDCGPLGRVTLTIRKP